MQEYNTIIGNLFNSVDRRVFKRIVNKHQGERYAKSMTCWEQFVAIFLGQILKNCNSLRDIEDFLLTNQNQWYHLGIKHRIARSTLSYANNTKSWLIYSDLFYYLLNKLKIKSTFFQDINPVKIIDSTPIYLNLNLFDWATETIRIKGMKMHIVYDLHQQKPNCFTFSKATCNDIEEGKLVDIQSGVTYVFDRGYMDFNWWSDIDSKGAYFVTRLKRNNAIIELSEIQQDTEEISSQLIRLKNKNLTHSGKNRCSEKILRKVIVQCADKSPLILVTNDLTRSIKEIAELYKQRWQIELFFKWIKQNLQIKQFLGRSENAVKTQICIALISYLLIQEARELKELMSEVCKNFSESKFLKMINNNIFKTLKPKQYGRTRDNPWQLRLKFNYL